MNWFRLHTALSALCLFFVLGVARADNCACSDWQKAFELQLRAVEVERYNAFTSNDFAKMSTQFGDDLIYVHSTGSVQSKSDLLAALKAGDLRYRKIQTDLMSIRFYGETAILNGRGVFDVTVKEKNESREISANLIFTAIYVLRGEGVKRNWQLVSWHSVNAPQGKS